MAVFTAGKPERNNEGKGLCTVLFLSGEGSDCQVRRASLWLHLLLWHTAHTTTQSSSKYDKSKVKKKKKTVCKPFLSDMFLLCPGCDEGSTLPTAFLWWQKGHITLRSQNSGGLMEDSGETRRGFFFFFSYSDFSWAQDPFLNSKLFKNNTMRWTHCGCSL